MKRMQTSLRWAGRASTVGLASILVIACALGDDESTPRDVDAADASLDADSVLLADAQADAADAGCNEGRRRCVGLDLEVCESGRWTLLQSCLQGEWCDVAVGICRMVDAGADSGK